jgi:hypothetical protein
MTVLTQTWSCWREMQHAGERRSGQLCTPTSVAAVQTGVEAPAAFLEEARTATAVDGSRKSMAFAGRVALSPRTGTVVEPATLLEEAHMATAVDGSRKSTAFAGRVALSPRTGTVATTGTRLLPGTLALVVGGLPSPRPTMLSGLR